LNQSNLITSLKDEVRRASRIQPLDFPRMAVLVVVAVVATDLLQMPKILSLDNVAFGDGGFNLTVQALIDRGYRAGADFGYPYGALSLLYGKLWFAVFGLRPPAFFGALVLADVIFALGWRGSYG
jgi:hypothetical protein